VGGTGTTTTKGGEGNSIEYINTTTGGLFHEAGGGNETIDASLSRGPVTLFGGSLDSPHNQLLIGGAGNDIITAGTSAETLVGGGGANQFFFTKGEGGPGSVNVISDFSAIDVAYLADYGPNEAAAALAGATTAGGSTTITLSDNTKITFTGVTSTAALTGHVISF
jgi:Ca2+-binding RTX toxin-like protein